MIVVIVPNCDIKMAKKRQWKWVRSPTSGILKCLMWYLSTRGESAHHIEHFKIYDVELLTLSHPLRADVHNGFHSIDIDLIVALTYLYLVKHIDPAYR
jgi:hypothetical protein